jgi:predicted exporter/SAM-dependent methyltransferase
MSLRKYQINWTVIFIVTLIVAGLFFWESKNLKIETDILESMPHNDPVLADARQIIRHLPIQDRLFIDLGCESTDRDKLIQSAALFSDKLSKSGLFTKVGIGDDANNFPELIAHVNNNLPSLLSASDLEQKIKPLLSPDKIRETMAQNRKSIEQLEGIGRSGMMTKDPLGFSGVIMSRMSALLPSNKAQFYQGQLMSEDGRHVLIIAKIKGSGTDTAVAVRIQKTIDESGRELNADKSLQGDKYTITATGAYRAALDNETIAKRDTRLALILTTLGIALLLIFAFPRPLIGLLALLPSTVGMIAALFVCSFLYKSISMLAVGFGGAIMGFTVDLGITYLLFLDQPYETKGKKITRTVWSAELLAVLTTAGSFLLLLISDFKIMAQIGVFSALGVLFALVFVLFIFPLIFPIMPPATRRNNPFLMNAIKKVAAPAKWKLAAAVAFGLIMLFFAWPEFNVDLNAMNSVSRKTLQAGEVLQKWGDFSGKCYVFMEAKNLDQLQKKNAQLMDSLSGDVRQEKLAPVFLPSVLFPSPEQAQSNFAAWRAFWTKERVADLQRNVNAAARESGFAPDAFAPFWKIINQETSESFAIPEKFFEMLGISQNPAGYTQLSVLIPGKNYNAEDFFSRLKSAGTAELFDVSLFNKRLGEFLKNIFIQIALITGIGTSIIVFIYYLDWIISLAVLAPITFALIATLGTLKIIGHPMDIPGIMLWVIIMGMGINYSIYYACFYQRYRDESLPEMDTVKLAMFLASFTTLIGFGVLALANHALLKSIGVVSLLGIFYSLIGAYFILPVLMKAIFSRTSYSTGNLETGSREHQRRTVARYRHLGAYPRMFARMKMIIDPMFRELDQYVKNPRSIIDIGCGYGVPAVWLLEIYPEAKVYGLEPDDVRVLIASHAIATRGRVQVGLAPDLPDVEGEVDYVLMLDMLHFLDDAEAQIAFLRIYEKLEAGGTLLVRATIPSDKPKPWKRWIEVARLKITQAPNRFRGEPEIVALLKKTGFTVQVFSSDFKGIEEKWFVGKKDT